jgi:hypothetical protein
MTKTDIYVFAKGQKLHLDDIYTIQGLAGGNWWTADDPNKEGGDAGEIVTITENIVIKVKVTRAGK